MTLIEKCKELDVLLHSHKTMVADHEKAKSMEERRRELVALNGELAGRMAKARVYLEGSVLVREGLPPLAALKDKVQPVLENFRTDPFSITRGKTYNALVKFAEVLAEKFDKALNDAWVIFFKNQVPYVDNGLLARYQESGQFKDKILNICRLLDVANRYKGSPPATKEELDDFLAQSKALRDECSELQEANLPEDVLAFFRAANSTRGASLSLLTSSVSEWLREHGMFETFRIRR